MVGFDDVLNSRPEVFSGLADQWERLAGEVRTHHEQWHSSVRNGLAGDVWHGRAGDAARAHVEQVGQRFSGHEQTLRQVSGALRRSAAEIADARSRLVQAQQQAARLGLVVDGNGRVTVDPARLSADLRDLPTSMAAAEVLGREIEDAVRSANAADQRAATTLDALTPRGAAPAGTSPAAARTAPAGNFGEGTGGAVRDQSPPGAPPRGSEPAKIKQWWDSLSPDQQKQYADRYAGYVGSTDGIPATARDTANRKLLAETEARLAAQYRDPNHRGDREALKKKLIGIHDIQTRLAGHQPTGDADPDDPTRHRAGRAVGGQQFLLGFSADGQGRAIISTGNPDTAENVVTTVPGVGRGLNDVLYQDLSNNDATADGMRDAGGTPGKSAQIMWVGYDAPPADAVPPLDRAEAAAPALESFQRGLLATHQGTPAHLTVVGHSYGSDVVAETTMNGHKLVADDVVLIGSPGVPMERAYEIEQNMIPSHPAHDRYPPTEVWAGAAGRDTIARSGALGHIPTDPAFGAAPFAVDPSGDHGGYWQGIGLRNISEIALGDYDQVQFEKRW